MKQIEILVPKLGMDTTEAVITAWLVSEGDNVEVGTPLVELESEKITFELESEFTGLVRKIMQPIGTVVPVGSLLAIIEGA